MKTDHGKLLLAVCVALVFWISGYAVGSFQNEQYENGRKITMLNTVSQKETAKCRAISPKAILCIASEKDSTGETKFERFERTESWSMR